MIRPWTTTEARTAKQMRSDGTVVSQIAATLGRTDWSVYSFLRYNYTSIRTTAALTIHCPECGAKPQTPCTTVRGLDRKSVHYTRAHAEAA